MIHRLWRTVKELAYRRDMGSDGKRLEPVRRLESLDEFLGLWVAVKDGAVIASAYNSRDLVPAVRAMGKPGEGAVAQYVPRPSADVVVGIG